MKSRYMRRLHHTIRSRSQPKNRGLNAVLIIISVLCIVGAVAMVANRSYFTQENQLQREIEQLAADYYENYYYENYFLNIPESDRMTELQKYLEHGTNPVYLRELLNYDNNRDSEAAQIFQSAECDTNTTSVRYFTEAPYGKTDFHTEYKLSCKALETE